MQVSSVMAPAALALECLGILTMLPAAVAAAGVALCRRASGLVSQSGVFYVAVASMVAAVYYDYATVWFCCAYALVQGVTPLEEKKITSPEDHRPRAHRAEKS
jgi:hypothetical protein